MSKHETQSAALKRLVNGYKNFHTKYFESGDTTLYQDLVSKGQAPKTMIVACSDSRVDPAIILGCSPGELFVVRNVANLVPPCENDAKRHGTSAALEFAVCFLEVEHIIILGHTLCGGIQALLSEVKEDTHGFISHWMEIAHDARIKALKEHTNREECERHCGEYSLMASLNNLYTFPWINERVAAGILSLHAWYFDLENGEIRSYNPVNKNFEKLI